MKKVLFFIVLMVTLVYSKNINRIALELNNIYGLPISINSPYRPDLVVLKFNKLMVDNDHQLILTIDDPLGLSYTKRNNLSENKNIFYKNISESFGDKLCVDQTTIKYLKKGLNIKIIVFSEGHRTDIETDLNADTCYLND